MSDDEAELAAVAGDLADTLEELRDELATPPRREGPLGLPAPPTPRELLRVTDEYAIPFAIAVLEANVRALEALQAAISLLRSGEAATGEARAARDRAEDLSRETLQQLEGVLADLERAVEDGALPRQEDARAVLTEARDLRAELSEALEPPEEPADPADDPVTDAEGEPLSPDEPEVDVDVEGELDSIRAELDRVENGEGGDDEDAEDGDDER
jgi:hypothetical protein